MSQSAEIQEVVTSYLLGESSSAQEHLIEEQFASDRDFLDFVISVEDDLIAKYVRHQLPTPQRLQFEKFFLRSPENCERVEFARILRNEIEQRPAASTATDKSSYPEPVGFFFRSLRAQFQAMSHLARLSSAAILLIALGSALWFLLHTRTGRRQIEQPHQPIAESQNVSERPRSEGAVSAGNQTEAAKPNEASPRVSNPASGPTAKPPGQKPATIASFVLIPGVTRSGGKVNQIEIQRNVRTIELRLSVDSTVSYSSYDVSLRQPGQNVIWHRQLQNPTPKGAGKTVILSLKIAAKRFAEGEYLLTLMGRVGREEPEPVADYAFSVAHKT